MNDEQIKNYIGELGKLGFVWQFITLAGFHVNGLAVELFAQAYQKDRMMGYVRDVQRRERETKSQFLKHQQWSGVAVVDEVMDLVTGGTACTKISSEGITEKQFDNNH
jgi:isocitrate lyase